MLGGKVHSLLMRKPQKIGGAYASARRLVHIGELSAISGVYVAIPTKPDAGQRQSLCITGTEGLPRTDRQSCRAVKWSCHDASAGSKEDSAATSEPPVIQILELVDGQRARPERGWGRQEVLLRWNRLA